MDSSSSADGRMAQVGLVYGGRQKGNSPVLRQISIGGVLAHYAISAQKSATAQVLCSERVPVVVLSVSFWSGQARIKRCTEDTTLILDISTLCLERRRVVPQCTPSTFGGQVRKRTDGCPDH